MKNETITQRILTAEEGMYLTNGESVVETVVLPVDADASVWKEISAEEAQNIMNTEEDIPNV